MSQALPDSDVNYSTYYCPLMSFLFPVNIVEHKNLIHYLLRNEGNLIIHKLSPKGFPAINYGLSMKKA